MLVTATDVRVLVAAMGAKAAAVPATRAKTIEKSFIVGTCLVFVCMCMCVGEGVGVFTCVGPCVYKNPKEFVRRDGTVNSRAPACRS